MTGKSASRFSAYVHNADRISRPLSASHPALREGRSIFDVNRAPRVGAHVLISGMNQRKIGHKIVKGPWAGLPVYTLSLEERATCPRTCKQWAGCYGNTMPYAARWDHGPTFERALFADLFWLAGRHRAHGFAVRVHVLGDFYSLEYVAVWREALEAIPGLRIWGYTAREKGTSIGDAVAALNSDFPDRCVIRRSGIETVVVKTEREAVNAIICPVETGAAKNCGSCGLCWAPGARSKTIAFLFHGMGGGRKAAAGSPPSASSPPPVGGIPDALSSAAVPTGSFHAVAV